MLAHGSAHYAHVPWPLLGAKMRLSSVTSLAILASCAHAQILEIPAVDELVSAALEPLADYTDYHGPTGNASADLSKATEAFVANIAVEAADVSYWLAEIAHQGKAAFNPNPSSYTVFRNVKDYGAKGIQTACPML